jgi:hypothetical protein
MCQNNLREDAFHFVDPNEDGSFVVDWVDPSDPSLLLPAVSPGARSSEPAPRMEQINDAPIDHGFELMV